jgi:hypothetical protein
MGYVPEELTNTMDMKDGILFLAGLALGYYVVAHYMKTGKAA